MLWRYGARRRPVLHLTRGMSHLDAITMAPYTMELARGVLAGDRLSLSKAITLVESTRADHRAQADLLSEYLAAQSPAQPPLVYRGQPHSMRLGVAGPPGAGKSTFIERLGLTLLARDAAVKVAVVPVDPSSHIGGGSILGDKTRMEQLSRESRAYIRGSPTRGALGGVAEHTADVIALCEAAGHAVVVVESVGLGQSEVEIDQAVDMLVVLVPPGGGDGLQASKKGIVEAADLIVVNKADGPLLGPAQHTQAAYAAAMQFVRPKPSHRLARDAERAATGRAAGGGGGHPHTPVLLASAATGAGMDAVLQCIDAFHAAMSRSGALRAKREGQALHWMTAHLQRQLLAAVARAEAEAEAAAARGQTGSDAGGPGGSEGARALGALRHAVRAGRTTPRAAASRALGPVVRALLASTTAEDVNTDGAPLGSAP